MTDYRTIRRPAWMAGPKGRRTCALLLVTALMCGGFAACANTVGPPALDVAATANSPMRRAVRDSAGNASAAGEAIQLTGAVNDTVAFEYVLASGATPAAGLTVTLEDLVSEAGTIPRDRARIYRHWPVTIERYANWYVRSVGGREPREFLDVLVPIDAPAHGQPFSLGARSKLALWIEIRVPPQTMPGRYEGDLVVRDFDGRTKRTRVSLEIVDVFLSYDDSIAVPVRVNLAPLVTAHSDVDPENPRLMLETPESRRAIEAAFKLLHDHGLDPYTDEIYPRFEQDIDGSLVFDWAVYDAVCGPLITGAIYADGRMPRWWPLPVDVKQPDPALYGGPDSTTYAAVLRDYLTSVANHFAQNDWLRHAFVAFRFPTRANPTAQEIDLVGRLARLSHLVQPDVPFHSALIPQSMAPFGWFEHAWADLEGLVDIWATPARYQHPATMRQLQAAGRLTWLAPDRPPYSGSLAIEASSIDARSLAWQAFLQGHQAIELQASTDWPDNLLTAPVDVSPGGSDRWLLYPGTMFGLREPVPSVRLKRLEQGLRDYQRLRLLAAAGRAETARLLAGSLIKAAGTEAYGDNYQDGLFGRRVEDPEIWALAREVLDRELAAALSQEVARDELGGASREEWSRLLGSTRGLQAWVESIRLRPDSRGEGKGFLLSFETAVRSELRTPVQGKLDFSSTLPFAAQRESDVVTIGPIQEMGMARRRLTMSLPGLPQTTLDGHLAQGLVFDAGPSGRVDVASEASIVCAIRNPFPIQIDGRLEDWAPAAANAAGDFRLISAIHPPGQIPPPAKSRTMAYFAFDDEFLFIGLHAAVEGVQRGEGDPPLLRNTVRYEDLMPCDEDLVEVLIDPSNGATQSDDLYHIVIKSTGNPRFERGVGVEPPIGRVQPWPGEPPACCVLKTEYGWSAELAIPLAAFETYQPRGVWGVNIARLEPIRGEYSDWARAPRYCYDPRTLGNLVWPE